MAIQKKEIDLKSDDNVEIILKELDKSYKQDDMSKMCETWDGFDYLTRLRVLGLYSIYGRMLRANPIKIWKAFDTDVDVGLHTIFERHIHRTTGGHQFKL